MRDSNQYILNTFFAIIFLPVLASAEDLNTASVTASPVPAPTTSPAPPPMEVQPPSSEIMTLRQCLKEAILNSAKIKASDIEVEIREAERKSMRGHYLPVVTLDGKLLKFNDPVDLHVDMSFMGTLLKDFIPLMSQETLAGLAAFERQGLSLKVRDDYIIEGGVTVAQPLGRLYSIHAGERAKKVLVDAARQEGISVRRKVEIDVVKAYIGLVAATNMEQTIQAALEQLDAMEKQTEAYLNAEIVERNALLKVQVAQAEYQKNLFSAQKAKGLARAALNMLMGRPMESPLTPSKEGVSLDLKLSSDTSLAAQQKEAVDNRPELTSARYGRTAAEYGKKAAVGKMIPELNAIFRYHNTQGTGEMQPENEYFGGLVLSWNIWDWGVTYYEMRAAASVHAKVQADIEDGEDMVRLEVQSKRLDLEEAKRAVEVSEKQKDLADENVRIVQMRYDAADATTTELLEARTAQLKATDDLIIAEVNVDAAIYALAVARGVDLL